MKLLIFNYEYPPVGGGGGVVSSGIAEELAQRHRVCVVTSAYRDLPHREERAGVEIVRVPVVARHDLDVATLRSLLTYPPAAWLGAARLFRRERFDIINSHFAVPTGPGSLPFAKLAGIPHVLSLHGGDIYDPSKRLSPHRLGLLRATVNAALRLSDRVVAQSTNTRDNVYRYYSYRGPIDLIPLGIRKPAFEPATREELGLPTGVFLGVTVGRLVARKALDVLLRALLLPECACVHLAVIGAGPESDRLQGLARDLGLADRAHFLGRVSETRKWQTLGASDAYVSSTLHEGFGLVYLEAMAVGLPVVTPDYGGQIDFLRDGESGFLVPPGQPAALAQAIARLRGQPELVARIRQNNLRQAPEHRIERCAEAYEQLFEAALEARARGNTASVANPSGGDGRVKV